MFTESCKGIIYIWLVLELNCELRRYFGCLKVLV